MSRLLLSRYALGSLIGAGGSAHVFEAHDQLLDRRVAVKMLNGAAAASNDPAARDRFLREARSSAQFSHERVVAVYDAGEVDGDLFIVMELVDGRSLAQVIATDAPLSESEAVRIGGQLLDGLHAAHVAGVVHRDVKPANVLIDRSGDVKLADFGIAKRFEDVETSLTTVGTVVGTPQYLAPEQAAGEPATPPTDVYATGVVLFEMLTGVRPPPLLSAGATRVDLRAVRPDVSAPLNEVLARALAFHPHERFSTAAEMAASLRGRLPATERFLVGDHLPDGEEATGAGAVPIPPAPASTRVMVDAQAATGVMPQEVAATAVQPTGPQPRRTERQWWIVGVVAGLALALSGLAFALRDTTDDGAGDAVALDTTVEAAPTQSIPTSEPDVATSPAPVDTAPITAAATIAETTPPTAPPTAETSAPPGDLIPGFPNTDDIDQFIDQLRDGRDVVGKQSKKLGDGLRKVVDKDSDEQADEARELAEKLDEWVDDGEIDPVVAGATFEFLSRYAERNDD